MKKIIITGHKGYIGAHLIKLLSTANYEIVGIDTNYYDKAFELYFENNSIKEKLKDIALRKFFLM